MCSEPDGVDGFVKQGLELQAAPGIGFAEESDVDGAALPGEGSLGSRGDRNTLTSRASRADRMRRMTLREQDAAAALASVRMEGLDPSPAEPILEQWARGELSTDELGELAGRAAAGQSLEPVAPTRAT